MYNLHSRYSTSTAASILWRRWASSFGRTSFWQKIPNVDTRTAYVHVSGYSLRDMDSNHKFDPFVAAMMQGGQKVLVDDNPCLFPFDKMLQLKWFRTYIISPNEPKIVVVHEYNWIHLDTNWACCLRLKGTHIHIRRLTNVCWVCGGGGGRPVLGRQQDYIFVSYI